MIAIFKQKAPGNVALLLIFGLLIKLPLFLQPQVLSTPFDGRLYQLLIQQFDGDNKLIAGVLAFLLLYIQALLINYILNDYRMTARQTFLPAMAYLLITSLVPEWSYLSAPLISATFIIWSFVKLFALYNVNDAHGKIFNIGLLLGCASFFYLPSVLFVAGILVGFLVLRRLRINEFLLLMLALITPYYFFATYLFLADALTVKNLLPGINLYVSSVHPSYWLLASIVLMVVPFIMGSYYIQVGLRKMLIQARKNWSILLLYLLIAVFIPFINNTSLYTNWVLVAAPAAAFHACAYLYPPRRWLAGLLFFIILGFILFQQYGHQLWQWKA